jgi:hypothetical protein
MSQVIPTKSGAAIGVLLGGTGRAPASTCRPAVVPMLLKQWPGPQLDTTTGGSSAPRAEPRHERTMRSTAAIQADCCPSGIARDMPKPCRQSHGSPWSWPDMTTA